MRRSLATLVVLLPGPGARADAELEMLQCYRPMPIVLSLTSSYEYAVASDVMLGAAPQLALAGGSVRFERDHNEFLGDLMLDVGGSLGWATQNQLAYAV